MQIANAIADYDYYKNSRADTAAITAREKGRQRRDRDVTSLLVWLVVCPSRRLCLRLLSVSLYASWWCLLCPLRFYFVAIWHFANWPRFSSLFAIKKQKRKFYFFFVLSCCFFEPPPTPIIAPGRIFIAALLSPLFFLLFIAGDAKSIKVQLLLSISQRERNYSKCVLIIHTHTHTHTQTYAFLLCLLVCV